MFNAEMFGQKGLKSFIGQIPPCQTKNKTDPNGWGYRYQVRIHNLHPSEGNLLPDKDLPWATAIIPTSFGNGNKGSCGFSGGETVFGVFLDDDCQYPVILGSFPSSSSKIDYSLAQVAAKQSTEFKQTNVYNECNPAGPHQHGSTDSKTPPGQQTPLKPSSEQIKSATKKI